MALFPLLIDNKLHMDLLLQQTLCMLFSTVLRLTANVGWKPCLSTDFVVDALPLKSYLSGIFLEFEGPRKGGFSKEGFVENPAPRPREHKTPKEIGPSSACGTQSSTAKRGVHIRRNPLQKKPFLGS